MSWKEPGALRYLLEGIPKIIGLFLDLWKTRLRIIIKIFMAFISLSLGVCGFLNIAYTEDSYIKAFGYILVVVGAIVFNWALTDRGDFLGK